MELTTSWERTGMERVVLRFLRHRLGELPLSLEQRIESLSAEELEKLSDALLDITTPPN